MKIEETRAYIEDSWKDTPWIRKCLTVFDSAASGEIEPGERYGFTTIMELTGDQELSQDVVSTMMVLVGSRAAIFDSGGVFMDDDGTEFELSGEVFQKLQDSNTLSHPVTGTPVEEPQNKTYVFFRLRDEFVASLSIPTPA